MDTAPVAIVDVVVEEVVVVVGADVVVLDVVVVVGPGTVVVVVVATVVVVLVGGTPPPTRLTSVKLAWASAALVCAVRARPTNTVWAIGNVSVPTSVHVAPSSDRYPRTTLPAPRTPTPRGAASAQPPAP